MAPRTISVVRARGAIRLLGEARELGLGTEAARLHLLHGIGRELGVALGGAVDDRAYLLGGKLGCVRATLSGFDPQTFAVYYAHHELGSDVNPVHAALMKLRARGSVDEVTTATSSALVDRRTWDRAPWVAEIARPARVAHFLTSVRWLGPGAVRGFGLMRAAGDRPFSADDRAYLHLVASEVRMLFTDEASPHLSPRERDTLDGLLQALGDKEIAARLGLSPYTVHQYVKSVFRTLGVSSRAELIARHRDGGLGDLPRSGESRRR